MGIILQPPQPHDSLRGDSPLWHTDRIWRPQPHIHIGHSEYRQQRARRTSRHIRELVNYPEDINLRDYLCDYSMSPFFHVDSFFLILLSGKLFRCLDIVAINDEPAPRLINEAWKAVRNRSVLNQGRSPRRYNDGQLSGRLYFDSHYHNTSYCLPINR